MRLQVLLDTLGVSSEMLRGIQPDLHLQIFVTRYWLVNAQPQPSQMHLWGLLLGMVYGKFSSTLKGQIGIEVIIRHCNYVSRRYIACNKVTKQPQCQYCHVMLV